jgi:hypothetical protein
MGRSQKGAADQREHAARLQRLAEGDPGEALSHLSELPPLLVSADADTRAKASGALVQLSIHFPLELRSTSEALLARLDDVDPHVRYNILVTIANLMSWYPQDFGDGSNLMVESLRSDDRDERVVAAVAVTKLAYYRPDLVAPREEARDRLAAVRERDGLDDHEDFFVESEMLDGALQALAGGDMASRPLEDDLVPSGKRAPLSKPARVGITALLWVPLLVASMVTWTIRVWKHARKYRPHGARNVGDALYVFAHMGMDTLAKVFFLWPLSRARLYARRSFLVTPTGLVPWFAGTTPTKAKRRQTPPYPDDWATMATLVRQRDGHQCRNCGALGGPRDGDTELHVDHQHPRSREGPDHPSNLRTLCKACHEARHGRPFYD